MNEYTKDQDLHLIENEEQYIKLNEKICFK